MGVCPAWCSLSFLDLWFGFFGKFSAVISSDIFSASFSVYSSIPITFVSFFKRLPNCLPESLEHFAFLPAVSGSSCHCPLSPAFGVISVLNSGHSCRYVVASYCCFTFIYCLFTGHATHHMGILVPGLRMVQCLLQWKLRGVTTGSSGNPRHCCRYLHFPGDI